MRGRVVPIIELSGVSRDFDKGRIVALDNVSLGVQPGEQLAIVGPSGSGKSTLLNMICGLDSPSSGEVRVDGKVIAGKTAWARARATRFGIVFQNFCLVSGLSAKENIELAMLGQIRGAAERGRRAVELLDQVGLASRSRLRPGELSGGERQRVAIARALANSPDVLVADEPTGSLDRKSSAMILDLLASVQKDRRLTLIMVTHDMAIAASRRRLIEVVDGKIARDQVRPDASRTDPDQDRPAPAHE